MTIDPYAELQIPRDATPQDIRGAFLRASKKAHPDAGGSTEAFLRAKEAYRILRSDKLRAQWDKTGKVDEDEPDNKQAVALAVLSQWLIRAIDAVDTPEQVDMIDVMKQVIRLTNADLQKSVVAIETSIKRMGPLRERFSRRVDDGKPNLMALVVAGHIAQATRALEETKLKIKSNADTIKLIDEYRYEFDRALQPSWLGTGTATSSWGI